jgi:cell division protein FtsI (penicillin-binding protein 3)
MKSDETKTKFYYGRRFGIVAAVLLIWFLVILWRLIDLQVLHSKEYAERAKKQQFWEIELNPLRGDIVDRNGNRLALSIDSYSLYIMPKEIDNPVRTALILSDFLSIPSDVILQKISNNGGFFWLKRKIDRETAEAISKIQLHGVYCIEESSRYYPEKTLAAHTVGFVGLDNTGLQGAELSYDKYLKGDPIKVVILKDAASKEVMVSGASMNSNLKGSDLYLTLYTELQYAAEKELAVWISKYKAQRGTIIVMNPQNGEIYALANYPTFDLNRFNQYPEDSMRNLASQMEFEPGSIYKVIVAAAALEDNLAQPGEVFDCEMGKIELAGYIIKDHKPFGLLSFQEIIENSSNVGAIKIGLRAGSRRLYEYSKKFGIGEKTGIDLNGESTGWIRTPNKWSGISIGAVSIGQEVFTTPLQMLRVASIVANGGYWVKPHVGFKTVAPDGTVTMLNRDTNTKEKILHERTISLLKTFMRGVVLHGTGKLAEVDGYGVSGKTGTAQKIGPSRTYADGGLIASFMGYFPVTAPKVVMLVLIDDPQGVYWGSQVAAPLFSRIARQTAEVLRIPASEPIVHYAQILPDNLEDSGTKNVSVFDAVNTQPDQVPDLRGLASEDAVRRLHAMKLPFKCVGFGTVVNQVPDPGFPISMTQGVIIYLNPNY